MLPKPDSALVLVAHGSTLNPHSSAPTWANAAAIRRRGLFKEVACCFWKEDPNIHTFDYLVESGEVYVVPNFISEGYFTRTIVPRELGVSGRLTEKNGRTIKYCDPVGNDPLMTDLLLVRAREIACNVDPAETAVLIVGHGTGLNENSGAAVKREVERFAQRTGYASVQAAYMEEAPYVADWQTLCPQKNVIVLPFFISDGLHTLTDIPELLGVPGLADSPRDAGASSRVFSINGRTLYYSRAIGTDPGFAEIILHCVESFDREFSVDPGNLTISRA